MRTTGPPAVDEDGCVRLASDLVAIASPSGQEHDVASFLAGHLRTLAGVEVEQVEPANVVATLSGSRPGPRRLFLTHTDTVDPAGMRDPLTPRRLDGDRFGTPGPVLRGAGAVAPKSAVAAMVTALAAVAAAPESLAGSVQLAAVTKDLSADHAGLKEVLAHRPLEADWAVAGEPSGNRLVVGARGIMHVQAEFVGVPAHCGMPDQGANPLYGAADFLRALRGTALPRHPVLGPASLAPFGLTADAAPPRTPERASVLVDRRVLPDEDPDAILADLAGLANASAEAGGLQSKVVAVKTMYPLAIPADAPLVAAARSAAARGLGRDPGITAITFSSNAGYTTRVLGIPSVAFGPAEITDIGPDEHVSLDQLVGAARAYAALMVMDVREEG